MTAAGDRQTIQVYEDEARRWRDERTPRALGAAKRFAAWAEPRRTGRPSVDLGCGPGWYTEALGRPTVALDAARAMLDLVPEVAPTAWRVRADLHDLPFRSQALGAAWASRSYVHVARSGLPLALADLHRSLAVGARVELWLFAGDHDLDPFADDDFPGRRFSAWAPDHLADVVEGAGFVGVEVDAPHGTAGRPVASGEGTRRDDHHLVVRAARGRTLADQVGPGLRLLSVGLNPSLYAADAGVGFARPGNRFWPAALAAGLASVPRDPRHALQHHGLGMTDLVKRATVGAAELTAAEYRAGVARLERLVTWLQPGVVCFLGLAGWRAAVDRTAASGPIEGGFGGRPAYLMPNPSGLNASSTLDDLAQHLRRAAALAAHAPPPLPTAEA